MYPHKKQQTPNIKNDIICMYFNLFDKNKIREESEQRREKEKSIEKRKSDTQFSEPSQNNWLLTQIATPSGRSGGLYPQYPRSITINVV